MKKFLLYILIVIALVGLFNPVVNVNASIENPNEVCRVDDSGNAVNEPCIPAAGSTTTNPFVNNNYHLLAPLPGVTPEFNPENSNSLSLYLNAVIKVIIGLAAVLAVVMIVMGGIEYMTSELVSSKEAGKEKVTGAILGLLLALGAYALLFTINPNLLSTNINIKNEIVKVDLNADVPQTPVSVNGILRYGNYPVGADWTVIAGTTPSKPDWATINGPECTAVGQQNCTSTRGLGLSTLLTIHSNCTAPCPLIITGGTEFWLHGGATGSTTHQLGNSTVDLRPNTNLNNYIAGGQTLIRMKRYPKDGISYLWEGDHWHAGP